MMDLKSDQFAEFFESLYPYPPMTWQTELAKAACAGEWPDYICLPTGAGKTSTIDIAAFALACQAELPAEERTAAMRTYLVVDRRTVVMEAFYRARNLQTELANATYGILRVVADRLRSYFWNSSESNDDAAKPAPLSVVELRGGIYRDPAWCPSLVQPMIVTSTVDQVGSRLMFRGYGVSNSARPIQAAVVAHDSLVILDEAHISPAFSETLGYVKAYQREPWATNSVPLPMRVVEMTATPPSSPGINKLEISKEELENPATHIGRLVNTPKRTTLSVAEKVKGAKAPAQLAAALVDRAIEHCEAPLNVCGIMCNMVATAKEVHSLLLKRKEIESEQVHLVIGAIRPIDRDGQTDHLRQLISTGTDRSGISKPLFVVATQCIEVGADYDFDVLISEAAPLDSLIQRFGRLSRSARDIEAVGHIVMRGDRVRDDKQLDADDAAFKTIDPIYGNATSRTWNWLRSVASDDSLDFGIAAIKQLVANIAASDRDRMSTDSSHAPVLLPAHLDMLCQTSRDPWPDPDVSIWLHGPQRNDPEVQVCWRADLLTVSLPKDDDANITIEMTQATDNAEVNAIHAISLCPPSAAECLSIPLRRVQAWITSVAKQKKTEADLTADLPAIVEDTDRVQQSIPVAFQPVAWRGVENSTFIRDVSHIRPGDTLVFPVTACGWTDLGFLPDVHNWLPRSASGPSLMDALLAAEESHSVGCQSEDFNKLTQIDRGSEAFSTSRSRPILRLHPALMNTPRARELYEDLRGNPNFRLKRADVGALVDDLPDEVATALRPFRNSLRVEYYADQSGVVITGPRTSEEPEILTEDDGSDLYSRISDGQPVELSNHLEHVRSHVEAAIAKLPFEQVGQTLLRSAELHDWGKADPRFQAMLLGGDFYDAFWNASESRLYAKSRKMPSNVKEREFAHAASQLPKSFRHELLSMSLAELANADSDVEDDELLLHLIASHHGHARPWAPVCDDPTPPPVTLDLLELPQVALSEEDRQTIVYHTVDSPIIERFWEMTSKYGWWGAAFLESVLRLADRRASQIESQLQASSSERTKERIARRGVLA